MSAEIVRFPGTSTHDARRNAGDARLAREMLADYNRLKPSVQRFLRGYIHRLTTVDFPPDPDPFTPKGA